MINLDGLHGLPPLSVVASVIGVCDEVVTVRMFIMHELCYNNAQFVHSHNAV